MEKERMETDRMKSWIEATEREMAFYLPGSPAPSGIPSEKEIQNMLRLIAYDIADPKRLRLVARACEDYGVRIEKSVFECDLDEGDYAELWNTLLSLIDETEDSLIAYRVCQSCLRDTDSAGVIERPAKRLYYLF